MPPFSAMAASGGAGEVEATLRPSPPRSTQALRSRGRPVRTATSPHIKPWQTSSYTQSSTTLQTKLHRNTVLNSGAHPPPSNKPTQNAALPKCARHHQEVQLPESLHDTMARPQSERSPLPGRGAVHGITQSHGELYSIVQVPHQLFDSRARTETGARASCSGSGN